MAFGKSLKLLAAAMLGIALTLPLAAQTRAADAKLIEAARREGQVVWYTTLIVDQAVRPLAQAWAAAYPDVKLRFSRASSTDQALKITNEARAGKIQADVFDGSSTIFSLMEAGLVDSYKPASAVDYPADFRDASGAWTALNAYFMVPAYNTQNLPAADVPKKWEDLLNPKFRGKMAWATDESADGPAGFVGMILTTMGQEKGMDYLHKLAQQKIAQVPANQRVTLDQVIAGEYQLGIMMYNHHVGISQSKGAPVEWIRMDPALATINYLGVVKGAPHPNAARLLVEFLLSEGGQNVLRAAGYIPVNPKVPPTNPALRPDLGKFKYMTISTDTIRKKLPEWNRIYRELFR